jgi:hypothetical protein
MKSVAVAESAVSLLLQNNGSPRSGRVHTEERGESVCEGPS